MGAGCWLGEDGCRCPRCVGAYRLALVRRWVWA
jgi:hypothetical protein